MSSRFHIVIAGVSLAALGACQHSEQEIAWANRMHTQIVAEETTADLKIDTIVAGEKLGEVEREAVKYFAASYLYLAFVLGATFGGDFYFLFSTEVC